MPYVLKNVLLAFALAFSPVLFAEPPDDVGTGGSCPECTTTTTSPDDGDGTVPDDVGTGSIDSWWEMLRGSFE